MQGKTIGSLCFLAFLCIVQAEHIPSSQEIKTAKTVSTEEHSKQGRADKDLYNDEDSSNDKTQSASALVNGLETLFQEQQLAEQNSDISDHDTAGQLEHIKSELENDDLLSDRSKNQRSGYAEAHSASSGFGQAQAHAYSESGGNDNYGLNSYAPRYEPIIPYGSGLSSAHAQTKAISSGSHFTSAQAISEAHSNAGQQYQPTYYRDGPGTGPNFMGPNSGLNHFSSSSHAQAEAQSSVSGNLENESSLYGTSLNSASAQSSAESSSGGFSVYSPYGNLLPSDVNGLTDAAILGNINSRRIHQSEYIFPNKIPGINELIRCTRQGELHNLWTSATQCLVCTCIKEFNYLSPVCVSCAGCTLLPPIPRVPTSPPLEPTFPPVTPTLPPIEPTFPPIVPSFSPAPPAESIVSCSPLPSGTPFENPLHPCQICVCREVFTIYGKTEVQIECQENPQCVVPADVTTLPPLPDKPVPVPLPLCEKFPQNILFPHPSDTCRLCKCVVEISLLGKPEQHIICYPNPNCVPNPPAPEPITPEPYTLPPPIVTTEHNWVPPSPNIGPLPGPSPHESCRPYTPNQPFQHPWDECQICVCTESFAVGNVNIEVNCFTKRTCCLEPYEPTIPEPVKPLLPRGGKLILDPLCEYKSFGVEFVHPQDQCRICVCQINGNAVNSVCQRSPRIECLIQPQVLPGSSMITIPESHSSASAQSSVISSGQGSESLASGPSNAQFQSHAHATANAQSQVLNSQGLYHRDQTLRPTLGYNNNKHPTGYYYPGYTGHNYKDLPAPIRSASQYGAYGNYGRLNAIPTAEDIGNPQTHSGSGSPSPYYGYEGYLESQAFANAQSGLRPNVNSHPYPPDSYGQTGVPSSFYYPSLYPRPSYEVTPLYRPGQFDLPYVVPPGLTQGRSVGTPYGGQFGSGSNGISQAEAVVQTSGLGQATAHASSNIQTKSGNPEDIDELEERN